MSSHRNIQGGNSLITTVYSPFPMGRLCFFVHLKGQSFQTYFRGNQEGPLCGLWWTRWVGRHSHRLHAQQVGQQRKVEGRGKPLTLRRQSDGV